MLQQLALRDADELFALIDTNRKHLDRFGLQFAKKYQDLASVKRRMASCDERIRFGIWSDHLMIGFVSLDLEDEAEIAYWLGKQFCGRGIATVAVQAVIEYAKVCNQIEQIVAYIHPENQASQKVAHRVQMEEIQRSEREIKFSYRL